MSAFAVVRDALVTGLPYVPACLGVWMTYPLQRTFDLTVNGSFVVGAGVFAAWVSGGGHAMVGMVLAAIAGSLCGVATSLAMHYLKLGMILSGIIVGMGLFSVALWVMGAPNVNIIGASNMLTSWSENITGGNLDAASIQLFGGIGILLTVLLYAFLRTEFGLVLRANGTSKAMVRSNGKSPAMLLYFAVVVGNVLTAFSGSLVVQQQGFADVGVGLNTILLGVTAILIGQIVLGTRRLWQQVGGAMVGVIIYYVVLSEAFNLGLNPVFFQGITAGSVIVLVVLRLVIARLRPGGRASMLESLSIEGSMTSS